MDYGKRIKEVRIAKGMTQAEVAEKSGLKQSQVSMIETGERGLNVKTADKIAHALGVTLNELLAESEG
jgi:transcriptional regulator with XRE-family HTH domain